MGTKPTIGRTVLYVLAETDGVRAEAVGKARPAVVVEVNGAGTCNLKVALDGCNDWKWSPPPDHLHVMSVAEGTSPGSWQWVPIALPPAPAAATGKRAPSAAAPPPPPPPPPAVPETPEPASAGDGLE